jgi:hypothetical protein
VSRPLGVTLAAAVVVGVSAWILWPLARGAGLHRNPPLLVAAAVLATLALLAAEALWSLRPHAFVLFTLWSLAGIAAFVLDRVALHGSSHLARFVPSILYAGIAFAATSLYLRRAL